MDFQIPCFPCAVATLNDVNKNLKVKRFDVISDSLNPMITMTMVPEVSEFHDLHANSNLPIELLFQKRYSLQPYKKEFPNIILFTRFFFWN